MVIPTRGLYQPGVHFENADTKRRFKNMLDGYDLTPMLQPLAPGMADDEMLLRFHTREYLDKVKTLSDAMGGDAGDFAPVAPGSNEIARLGVGGTVDAFEGMSNVWSTRLTRWYTPVANTQSEIAGWDCVPPTTWPSQLKVQWRSSRLKEL